MFQLDEDLQRARCIVVDGDASSLLPGHAQGSIIIIIFIYLTLLPSPYPLLLLMYVCQ